MSARSFGLHLFAKKMNEFNKKTTAKTTFGAHLGTSYLLLVPHTAPYDAFLIHQLVQTPVQRFKVSEQIWHVREVIVCAPEEVIVRKTGRQGHGWARARSNCCHTPKEPVKQVDDEALFQGWRTTAGFDQHQGDATRNTSAVRYH